MKRVLILIVVILLVSAGYAGWKLGYVPEIGKFFASESGVPVADQLKGVNWEYRTALRHSDIPLPESMSGLASAGVVSIYSPSVLYFEGRWVMVFGVAAYCDPAHSPAAKDSIAYAESDDGINWQFRKYILEPDVRTCTLPLAEWPNDLIVNVNDPTIFVQDPSIERGVLHAFYTTAIWHNGQQCGNIGTAAFDQNLDLIEGSRNDLYYQDLDGCQQTDVFGVGRPDIQWLDPFTTRLWFDGFNGVYSSAPITRLDVMPQQEPRVELQNAGSGDLQLPRLSYDETILLQTGVAGLANGVVARSRPAAGGEWSAPWPLTEVSGDVWAHGSPHMALDEVACRPLVYFAAGRRAQFWWSTGDVPISDIAVAVPPADASFNFPACTTPISTTQPIGTLIPPTSTTLPATAGDVTGDGVVDIFDYNAVISNYGQIGGGILGDADGNGRVNIFDYNLVVSNF